MNSKLWVTPAHAQIIPEYEQETSTDTHPQNLSWLWNFDICCNT